MQDFHQPAPERPTSNDRFVIEIANARAVIHGPMQQLQVCWLGNGVGGQTLPEEMVSVGYHIVHPEKMPEWLIAKLDARDAERRAALVH